MLDVLKRTLYAGAGLAVLAKEKIEDLGKELAKQAKLSEQEGKELVDDLMKQSEAARADLETRIDQAVSRAISKLHLCSRSQFDEVVSRLESLEKKVSEWSESAANRSASTPEHS